MILQKQNNSWSCLPVALGILLNENADDIIKEIGHNGSEIIRPNDPEPYNRRGFHLQELIKICLKRNLALLHFEVEVNLYNGNEKNLLYNDMEYIFELMKSNDGLIFGQTRDGKPHAVAWSSVENCIFDPGGSKYARGWFSIESFLLLRTLE